MTTPGVPGGSCSDMTKNGMGMLERSEISAKEDVLLNVMLTKTTLARVSMPEYTD